MTVPQLYLIVPPGTGPALAERLVAVMDAHPPACVRLASGPDEASIRANAAVIAQICRTRDVPVLLETHFRLAAQLGLDGVHLTDGARNVRAARAALGGNASIGAFCGVSRHQGMIAGEAGADYVAFGPVDQSTLGAGEIAALGLFEWWTELIELPVVAEGGMTPRAAATLAPVADFLAVGPEIWGTDDPVAALAALWPAG